MKKRVIRASAGVLLACGMSVQAASYSDVVLSEDPVGYWQFNEASGATATDSSVNANHGTYNGVVLGAAAASSQLGTAGRFNGGQNVRIPDIAAYDMGTGNFSVELWYRTSMANRGDILTYKGTGGDLGVQHNQNGDGVKDLRLYHTAVNIDAGHQDLNAWHHVVISRSGTAANQTRIYVDGRLAVTGTDDKTLNIANDILIGSNHTGDPTNANTFFNGYVDEVAIYNTALSADAARTHYLAAMGRTVSVNFVGGGANGGASLGASEAAGHPTYAQSNWNNAAGTNGSLLNVVDANGAASTIDISWSANSVGALPSTPSSSGSSKMMDGYIDGSASVTASGIDLSTYDVIVYFDGDNGANWRKSGYTLTSDTGFLLTLDGEDSENRNFETNAHTNGTGTPPIDATGGQFQLPVATGTGNTPYATLIDFWNTGVNNDEGNFLVFRNVHGSSFTLTANAIGGVGASIAPINGLQIIGIPTPAALPAGLALLGILAGRRRR
jgi:hypothetical protein